MSIFSYLLNLSLLYIYVGKLKYFHRLESDTLCVFTELQGTPRGLAGASPRRLHPSRFHTGDFTWSHGPLSAWHTMGTLSGSPYYQGPASADGPFLLSATKSRDPEKRLSLKSPSSRVPFTHYTHHPCGIPDGLALGGWGGVLSPLLAWQKPRAVSGPHACPVPAPGHRVGWRSEQRLGSPASLSWGARASRQSCDALIAVAARQQRMCSIFCVLPSLSLYYICF